MAIENAKIIFARFQMAILLSFLRRLDSGYEGKTYTRIAINNEAVA
jgi:hypothetical protein